MTNISITHLLKSLMSSVILPKIQRLSKEIEDIEKYSFQSNLLVRKRELLEEYTRIIVIKVAGTIHLNDHVTLSKASQSNFTVIGQTAPNMGIQVTGGSFFAPGQCRNYIFRYIE